MNRHLIFHVRATLLGGLLSVVPGAPAAESGNGADIARVKSVFVYHYAQFVQWPQPAGGGEIRLCLVGGGEVIAHLQRLDAQHLGSAGRLLVSPIQAGNLPGPCRIVFLGEGAPNEYALALERMRGQPLLSISDRTDFAKQGGIIEMFVRDDKVRMRINLAVARSVGIRLSSKLLRLAEIVQSP